MKRKTLLICFCLLFAVLCFCSCQKSEETDEIKIVTTVFPQYDFARRITEGAEVSIHMLLPAGSEAHSYDPTPADMVKSADCDLFIWVGGESEAWAKKIIESSGIEEKNLLSLMETVPLIEVQSEHEDEHGHDSDALSKHDYDEHVWTSPKNAILIVEAIKDRLCELDESNAEIYRTNAEAYIKELTALDVRFEALALEMAGQPLVFGDRFPFLHLAEAYGFNYTSPFSGCSAHTEASVAEISAVIERADKAKSKVIFAVDFSNGKLAKTIADEVGAGVERLYSCHTLKKEDFDMGIGYVQLMERNLTAIEKAR